MGERELRFGVMCTGTTFPAWEAECIRELLALDGVEPGLLVVEEGRGSTDEETGTSRWRDRIRRGLRGEVSLWEWYERFFAEPRSRALERVDLSDRLDGVPRIRCRTRREGRYSEYFTAQDVARIRSHDLDFILRFAFGIIRGEILDSARLGVWSYHHGNPLEYRGGPPAFWEVYHHEPKTGAVLQRLTERLDAGVMLFEGAVATESDSHVKTRDRVFTSSAGWAARVAREVQLGGTDRVEGSPLDTDAPIYRAPGNVEMLRFLIRVLGRYLRQKWEELFRHEQWTLGVYQGGLGSFLEDPAPLEGVTWLEPGSRHRYLADPFPVDQEGELTVLAEEFDYRRERGRIVWARMDARAEVAATGAAFELPGHGSYPCLLRHRGEMYCVPETAGLGQVRLYRAVDFPREWELEGLLLAGVDCVDPTPFRWDDRWWLLATTLAAGRNSALHVWFADELTGPWSPHPLNPVKVDVGSSRPAGAPFRMNGHLYRPAQDCAGGYGRGLTINRITSLSRREFSEEVVRRVRPDRGERYGDGLHTLSGDGPRVLVDGRRRVFVPAKLLHRIGDSFDRWTGRAEESRVPD